MKLKNLVTLNQNLKLINPDNYNKLLHRILSKDRIFMNKCC